jgi:hypothetical protein
MYVDKHARQARRIPEFELRTFYGQLQHIFLLRFGNPDAKRLLRLDDTPSETQGVVILAGIRNCIIDDDKQLETLDVHFYSKIGSLDIIDIISVKCLVGRVQDGEHGWGIIDRSGSLARGLGFEGDMEE